MGPETWLQWVEGGNETGLLQSGARAAMFGLIPLFQRGTHSDEAVLSGKEYSGPGLWVTLHVCLFVFAHSHVISHLGTCIQRHVLLWTQITEFLFPIT